MPVEAVAIGHVDDCPVVVSGGVAGTAIVWDARTGTPLSERPLDHGAPIQAIALTIVRGRTLVVTGAVGDSIRIWNPLSGRQYGNPVAGYLYPLMILALAQWPDRPIAVGRGTTVEFGTRRIELESAITAITFTGPHDLVVVTKLGLICLRLTASPTPSD